MVRPGSVQRACCFGGEESAGASFLRHDGTVWTTEKVGLIMVLLAAETTARNGEDPSGHCRELTAQFGRPYYTGVDATAIPEPKAKLRELPPSATNASNLAGEPIVGFRTARAARKPWRGGLAQDTPCPAGGR